MISPTDRPTNERFTLVSSTETKNLRLKLRHQRYPTNPRLESLRNREIGQKPTSKPKLKISNWTRKNVDVSLQTARSHGVSNLQFVTSDLRWAFVQFPDSPIAWITNHIDALIQEETSYLLLPAAGFLVL